MFVKKRKWRNILLVLVCIFFYALLVEPFWIRTKEVVIIDEPFSHFFKTYKTVFISDIHASRLGLRERLLLDKLREISPDIIFLAGDYVHWGGNYEKTLDFLSRLKAKIGIFGVLGDSDYQNSRKACDFCHTFSPDTRVLPVRFLRNETIYLPVGQSQFAISGVELFQKDLSESKKIIEKKDGSPEILLSQNQIDLQKLSNRTVLVLSGDTHGGQAYMPGKIWQKLFAPSKGQVRTGLVEKGEKKLIVSSGIGTNRIPLRFLCPPEIIVFKGE